MKLKLIGRRSSVVSNVENTRRSSRLSNEEKGFKKRIERNII